MVSEALAVERRLIDTLLKIRLRKGQSVLSCLVFFIFMGICQCRPSAVNVLIGMTQAESTDQVEAQRTAKGTTSWPTLLYSQTDCLDHKLGLSPKPER